MIRPRTVALSGTLGVMVCGVETELPADFPLLHAVTLPINAWRLWQAVPAFCRDAEITTRREL